MEEATRRFHERWFIRFTALVLALCIGLVIGLTRRSVGVEAALRDKSGGPDMAMIKNSADIVQIYNLEAHYANALDSGRLGEVADLWTTTGGFGEYYQDPVTTHLITIGHPTDMNDRPITNFPAQGQGGCLVFGRENLIHFFHEGGNSIRPHVPGWPGGVGEYPGKSVVHHQAQTMWVVVNGDTAQLHDYYGGTQIMAESDLVRTPAGWRFQMKKVIGPKPSNLSCHIYDPKFPIPPPGSPGGIPNFVTPY